MKCEITLDDPGALTCTVSLTLTVAELRRSGNVLEQLTPGARSDRPVYGLITAVRGTLSGPSRRLRLAARGMSTDGLSTVVPRGRGGLKF
jgi:hypothetical protein